jgi:hypothetical protein
MWYNTVSTSPSGASLGAPTQVGLTPLKNMNQQGILQHLVSELGQKQLCQTLNITTAQLKEWMNPESPIQVFVENVFRIQLNLRKGLNKKEAKEWWTTVHPNWYGMTPSDLLLTESHLVEMEALKVAYNAQ